MMEKNALQAAAAQARALEEANDLDAALAAWQEISTAFAGSALGYLGVAGVLSRLRRTDEAASILQQGITRFPNHEKLHVDHAWLAHHAGDWPEADRRWAALRAQFPAAAPGYLAGAVALRQLRRFDEADALYAEALPRWPESAGMWADHASVAQARGDRAEAARRWAVLRERFPNDPASYLRPARELRAAGDFDAAETILTQAVNTFPDNPRPRIELAQIAQQRGQPAQALTKWDAVITAFPGTVDAYIGAATALNDLGRFADAQNVLAPALRVSPDSAEVAALNTWIAHYKGEFASAADGWAQFRQRFPNNQAGFTGGIASLLALSRSDEAAALAEEAVQLFPGNLTIAVEYARLPQHTQDWEEASNRWKTVFDRYPNAPAVRSGYAKALSRLGRWEEAELLLETAIGHKGGDITLMRGYAECASQRGDWEAAEQRWRQVAERFPEKAAGWIGLAETFRDAGRLEEAAALLDQLVQRFPGNVQIERQLAMAATLRRDWLRALPLWVDLKRKHPQDAGVAGGVAQALWQARQDLEVAASEGGPPPFAIPAELLPPEEQDGDHQSPLTKLLLGFESIGDTCEFGIVQRRFGAEPISLLRWTSTPPHHLVTALNTQFAGVGEAEYTLIAVINGEYTSRDKRYHMFSHSFTNENTQTLEQFTKLYLRRMQYLRRKLLEDLADTGKIFVYKSVHGLNDDQVRGIYDAIRRYGGRQGLLCVELENAAHPRGTLRQLDDGLFMGYIDRFSTVDINVDVWVELCQKAQAAWMAMAGEAA
jgi:tetratricopeptide (TPR) repeat protein